MLLFLFGSFCATVAVVSLVLLLDQVLKEHFDKGLLP